MPTPPPAGDVPGHLRRLERLPFPARMRALAALGRSLTGDAFAELHALLDAAGDDDRHTALFLAVTRRDLDRVERALFNPVLRRRALSAAGRLPVRDEALVRLAHEAPAAIRRDVYRLLRRSRRRALAEALLPAVAARFGDGDAGPLLLACGPAVVRDWLPRVAVPPGMLRSLARTAPVAVATHLAAGYAAHGQGHRWGRRFRGLPGLLARRSVEAGLVLLRDCPAMVTAEAAAILLSRPDDVLRIIREHQVRGVPLAARRLPPATERALRGLSPAELAELSAAFTVQPVGLLDGPGETRPPVDPLLLLRPPAERRRDVEAAVGRARRRHRLPVAGLAALTVSDRTEVLGPLVERQTHPVWRIKFLAMLPLPLAEERLREATGSHQHLTRELGWWGLLRCAQLHGDPADYARVLATAERAWHDREAVRTTALRQAAQTPPGLLPGIPLPVLRDATLTTVQLSDTTVRTRGALATWLRRVAAAACRAGDVNRAAEVTALLVTVAAAHPRMAVGRLGADAATAAAVWRLVAARCATPGAVVCAARLLGPQLPAELDATLARVWRTADDAAGPDPVAPDAVKLWLTGPGVRDARIGTVVAEAPTAVLAAAWPAVATRRTDLVDTMLDRAGDGPGGRGGPPGGRAGAGVAHWPVAVPAAAAGRWLPAQRRRWQQVLTAIVRDEQAPPAVRAAAAVRIDDPELLLTCTDSETHAVAAAALTALGERADPDTAMPALLGAAGSAGARARAALAGLTRLSRRIPEEQAVTLCRRVLLAPASVGAGKGAARALAGIASPAVREALHEAWRDPGLHRDVRAAVARGLLPFVADPATAAALTAGLDDAAVRDAVLDVSQESLPVPARSAYAAFVAGALSHVDPAVALPAARAYSAWLPLHPAGLAHVARLVAGTATDAAVQRECTAILVAQAGTDAGARAWQAAVTALDGAPGGAAALAGLADPWTRLPAARLDVLVDPLARARRPGAAATCALHAAFRAFDEGVTDPRRWHRYLRLVGDRPQRILRVTRYDRHGEQHHVADDDVEALVDVLERAGGPAGDLAALDVLAMVGLLGGWRDPWTRRVVDRRSSPDPDLAEAAWLIDVTGP